MKLLPASASERISLIDMMRGLAVFGIFFVNIQYISTISIYFERKGLLPEGEPVADQWVRQCIELLFAGKMYPMLAFLFGVGSFLLMSRAEQKGMRLNRFFLKRLAILYVMGAAHMLFFYGGDILRTYALLGGLLLLFYRRQARTVLRWAVSILALFLLLFSLAFIQPASDLHNNASEGYTAAVKDAEAAIAANRGGNYAEWLSFHIKDEVLPALTQEQITYPSTFGMMLLGFYCGRIGLFQRVTSFIPQLRRVRNITGAISLLVMTTLLLTRLNIINAGVYEGTAAQLLIYGFGIFLSFFYMSSMILAVQKPAIQKLLQPFQSVGRMTLTNYLLQSIISVTVFTVFHFYAKLTLLEVVAYCLVVIAAEIAISRWWMARFPLGPMEWVWRRLTYGKLKQSRT